MLIIVKTLIINFGNYVFCIFSSLYMSEIIGSNSKYFRNNFHPILSNKTVFLVL